MVSGKMWKGVAAIAVVVALFVIVVSVLAYEAPAAKTGDSSGATTAGESFVYLFDSVSETFVFTFPVPTAEANPRDVIVVDGSGHQDIWFTQPGVGRIGKLTYTDTNDYEFFDDYGLPAGSRPLNLVSGGGFIWFTDPGRDSMGRLDPASGAVEEFDVPAGAYPADLDYAPDGSIWFTEMMRDRIAQLVITSTEDYAVREHYTTALSGGRPYGIAVAREDIVYFAETENDGVTRFVPPDDWRRLYDFTGATDAPNGPYEVVVEAVDEVWTTERVGNRLTRFKMGTLQLAFPKLLSPPDSMPMGLAIDKRNDDLWFTQWSAGQIGHFSSVENAIKYHRLPLAGLTPTGIAVDGTDHAWVLASGPYRVYLPLVMHSGG